MLIGLALGLDDERSVHSKAYQAFVEHLLSECLFSTYRFRDVLQVNH